MTKKPVLPLSDLEEARIQRQIASDSDASEASDVQLAEAKPFAQAFPALMESIERKRGRPRKQSPKQAVTLRLSPETLERFRATGEDWRSRMSDVLEKTKP